MLADLAGFSFVLRGKEYSVLDHPQVQARLHLPPDHLQQRGDKPGGAQPRAPPLECQSGLTRVPCREVVATHPESSKKSPVGVTRAGIVYELFFTTLPEPPFTACDVVELYFHRGAFEPALAYEDEEQDGRSLVLSLGLGPGVLAGSIGKCPTK